jgi:hypothetical protein
VTISGPHLANHNHALAVGAACLIAGTWFIYDAYERRGVRRPWTLHFLPGL